MYVTQRTMTRTINESVRDKLLLLALIDEVENLAGPIRETRLHKLVFLAERRLLASHLESFHYIFIKLKHGPYSRTLDRDKSNLILLDYLSVEDENGLVLSEKGREILKRFSSAFKRNDEVLRVIREDVRKFAQMSLKELMEYVYSLPRPLRGSMKTIGELPVRTPLLMPRRFKKGFFLTEAELVKLRAYFNPDVEEVVERKASGFEVMLVRMRNELGYTAIVPDLPYCISQGESEEEALRNVEEAIVAHIVP